MGPMEIRDFTTLVNKSRLMEEYNKKLTNAKFDAYRKRLAHEGQRFEHALPPKKQFQPSGHKRKYPQKLIVKQECPKYGKDYWVDPVWPDKICASDMGSRGI